jgi:hypothetical protein
VARDWQNETLTITALQDRLDKIAPGNTAPVPIAAAMEHTDDGEPCWTVDVHVRIPGEAEYEVTGAGKTLCGALRRAYLGLNNEKQIRDLSAFGRQLRSLGTRSIAAAMLVAAAIDMAV